MITTERAYNEFTAWNRNRKRWLIGSITVLVVCALLTKTHYLLPYVAGAIGGASVFARITFDLREKILFSTLSRVILLLSMISVGTVVQNIVETQTEGVALSSTAIFFTSFAMVGLIATLLFWATSKSIDSDNTDS